MFYFIYWLQKVRPLFVHSKFLKKKIYLNKKNKNYLNRKNI